jgi:hypothetical protein
MRPIVDGKDGAQRDETLVMVGNGTGVSDNLRRPQAYVLQARSIQEKAPQGSIAQGVPAAASNGPDDKREVKAPETRTPQNRRK